MKTFFLSLSCLLSLNAFSQSLLLNGGFEDENICTEYKINCAPDAWIINSSGSTLGFYFNDPNRAYQGEHCMAIEAGHSTRPYERTFIRSPLLCQLKKGNIYRLELYIKSFHPVLDSIGVYFGSLDPLLERKPIHLLSASLYLASNNKFVKDSSWQRAVIDYTANGTETFITVANFSRNDVTGNTGIRRQNQFLVFVDNITLTPLNPAEGLCANWQQVKEDIYDQNERHQYMIRALTYRQTHKTEIIQPGPTLQLGSDSLLLPDVLFATGKKELRQGSFVVLDSFCRSMKGKIIDSLVIEGHTDNTGTAVFNEQLSLGRAGSAVSYLQACTAFGKISIITKGWGSRKPVGGNDTPVGRQKNRRVEIIVYFRE
jgi:outer membrane protein OmpA-like peptidoglycan-associated protein